MRGPTFRHSGIAQAGVSRLGPLQYPSEQLSCTPDVYGAWCCRMQR